MAIAKAMAANGATIVFNDIKQELVDKGIAADAEAGIKACLLYTSLHGWGRRGKRHLIQKDQPCFAAWKQKSKTEKEQKIRCV